MMDSQENTLEQGITEEEKKVEDTAPQVENAQEQEVAEESKEDVVAPTEDTAADKPVEETTAAPEESAATAPVEEVATAPKTEETAVEEKPTAKVYDTKAEVLTRVREIAQGEDIPQKDEVDHLKTTFYKLLIADRDAKQK